MEQIKSLLLKQPNHHHLDNHSQEIVTQAIEVKANVESEAMRDEQTEVIMIES